MGVALQSTVRESDFVVRYGGDEFIMLLPDADREKTLLVAERASARRSRTSMSSGATGP